MRLGAVIFGGGATGLWLLDRLSRDGHHVVLLESRMLGAGESVGSQGILHVERAFETSGFTSRLARPVRELPLRWRDAMLGRVVPNLTRTRLRADACYLWRTDAPDSDDGIAGNTNLGQIDSAVLSGDERPAVLADLTGPVHRLNDQVICPASLLADLADQYQDHLLRIDAEQGLRFRLNSPGEVDLIELTSPVDGSKLALRPRQVIFTAGRDNARLRHLVGLSAAAIPSRSWHMVLARGNLPELNGHCLEGNRILATITSDIDDDGRVVWQIGGRLAKTGFALEPSLQTERVRSEMARILPGIDLQSIEWSTYHLDRSEGSTGGNAARDAVQILCAGNVTTACPTRLVLAPIAADEIADRASSPFITSPFDPAPLANWPRPELAPLPWNELDRHWWTLPEVPVRQVPHRRAA